MHFKLFPILLGSISISHTHAHKPPKPPSYPTRLLAGIPVIDTPIVQAAESFAYRNNDLQTYNHVMRSWLFGALVMSHNSTLGSTIDLEVHAVATLLHDLGWAFDTPLVSPDRRFEVDSAIASRDFILSYNSNSSRHNRHPNPSPSSSSFDARRIQLVWDAVALHTESRIAQYKEPEVALVSLAIGMDFGGPGFGVTPAEYDAVVDEFPKTGFRQSLNGTMIRLCRDKPGSTYDTFIQGWGERYVQGYGDGVVPLVDAIFRNLP